MPGKGTGDEKSKKTAKIDNFKTWFVKLQVERGGCRLEILVTLALIRLV